MRDGHRNLELIQVTHSLSAQKTREREFRSLFEAGKELGAQKLTILTREEQRIETQKGTVLHILPVETWLQSG